MAGLQFMNYKLTQIPHEQRFVSLFVPIPVDGTGCGYNAEKWYYIGRN